MQNCKSVLNSWIMDTLHINESEYTYALLLLSNLGRGSLCIFCLQFWLLSSRRAFRWGLMKDGCQMIHVRCQLQRWRVLEDCCVGFLYFEFKSTALLIGTLSLPIVRRQRIKGLSLVQSMIDTIFFFLLQTFLTLDSRCWPLSVTFRNNQALHVPILVFPFSFLCIRLERL